MTERTDIEREAEQLRDRLDHLYEDHKRAYERVDAIEAEMGHVRARMAELGVQDEV